VGPFVSPGKRLSDKVKDSVPVIPTGVFPAEGKLAGKTLRARDEVDCFKVPIFLTGAPARRGIQVGLQQKIPRGGEPRVGTSLPAVGIIFFGWLGR